MFFLSLFVPGLLLFFSVFSFYGFTLCQLLRRRSSRERWSSAGGDSSPARYPPPYDVTNYIRDFSSHFDTLRFSVLPTSGSVLIASYGWVVVIQLLARIVNYGSIVAGVVLLP